MDAGLLILRLVFGLGLAAHGAQKLFAWFDGQGVSGTGRFLETLGFFPGRTFARLTGIAEVAGGLLMALGLFGPIGPAIAILVMVVAMVTVHIENGFFNQHNGIELPLLYCGAALPVAVGGPGAYSMDSALGMSSTWSGEFGMIAVALGIIAGLGSLFLRRETLGKPVRRAT